jgi:hypothetical protein
MQAEVANKLMVVSGGRKNLRIGSAGERRGAVI